MKRRPKFLVTFITAALTVATLVAFVGNKHHHRHGAWHHGEKHENHCDRMKHSEEKQSQENNEKATEKNNEVNN